MGVYVCVQRIHLNISNLQTVGAASEKHCYADIEAAYDFLRNTINVPAKNIVLYGRSLGSGPSCHLAAGRSLQKIEESVAGVILHAPFLSVYRIVVDTGCTVYGDKFPNVDVVPMITSPVLLIHGTADQIVPFYHSEQLLKALPKNSRVDPMYIEGMSHNNVHAAVRHLFITRLCDFLDEHIIPFSDEYSATKSVKVQLKGKGTNSQIDSEVSSASIQVEQ
jgi:abhydrolase domain-containing protein 17